jgi:hypothetical protein
VAFGIKAQHVEPPAALRRGPAPICNAGHAHTRSIEKDSVSSNSNGLLADLLQLFTWERVGRYRLHCPDWLATLNICGGARDANFVAAWIACATEQRGYQKNADSSFHNEPILTWK